MAGKSSSSSKGSNAFANMVSGIIATMVVVAIILGYLLLAPDNSLKNVVCSYVQSSVLCHIIDSTHVQVNQDTLYVGLSLGNTAFDLHSSDSQDKQDAVDEMNAGHVQLAIQDWQHALHKLTDDAEAMIYIEDAKIMSSGQHYLTVVVVTTLSETPEDHGTSASVGRDDLRGIYMAQHQFNSQHSNIKLRVILANLGIKDQQYLARAEPLVLQRIVRLANTDSTFIGVIGFPFSTSAALAIPTLKEYHIPLISPSASASSLSSLSPYFFRVVPPDTEQGAIAAQFVTQALQFQHVAVFSDSNNSYSESLGNSFLESYKSMRSSNTALPVLVTVHNADSIARAVQRIASTNTQLVFLAGYADDVDVLKTQLAQQHLSVQVMSGDAAYELGGYGQGNYRNFYFTAFTYPDAWNILCNGSACGTIPSAADPKVYANTFDPNGQHSNEYSFSRMGPHVWLSYDALTVLLQASDSLNGDTVDREAITNALSHVSLQGASGQISFQGSNPVKKTIFVLCINSNQNTQVVYAYGDFAPGAKQPFLNPDTARALCS